MRQLAVSLASLEKLAPRGNARRAVVLASGLLAVVAAVMVSTTSASAATQLTTPGTPVANQVTQTSIRFSWTPSRGAVANYTIQVIDGYVPWRNLTTTTATTYTHTGLIPDKVYEYRVIANPANGGYTTSNPSGILYATTAPLPDSQPPTTPGTPWVYQLSTTFATLNFTGSTDNNRVAGYWAQRQINGVWTDIATNSVTTIYLRDLTPNTSYTFAVVAFDPNGNRSPRSGTVTFTTRALQPAPTCRVGFRNMGTSYFLDLVLENMTASTVVENWTVTFSMPTNQTITYSFNVTITRTGTAVTLTPFVWFTRIGPGGSFAVNLLVQNPTNGPLASGFLFNTNLGPLTCSVS